MHRLQLPFLKFSYMSNNYRSDIVPKYLCGRLHIVPAKCNGSELFDVRSEEKCSQNH